MYGKEKKHKQVQLHRTAASSECVSVYFSPTRPSTWTRYDVISSMNTFLVTVQNNPKESQHPHSWTWITNICLRAVKIELFWSSVKWVGSEFSNSSFFNETLYCFFTLQRGYSFTLLILLMSLYNDSCNLWCKSYKLYNELFSTTWEFLHTYSTETFHIPLITAWSKLPLLKLIRISLNSRPQIQITNNPAMCKMSENVWILKSE